MEIIQKLTVTSKEVVVDFIEFQSTQGGFKRIRGVFQRNKEVVFSGSSWIILNS